MGSDPSQEIESYFTEKKGTNFKVISMGGG